MSLRDELERVRVASGALTPPAVVEAARPEDSPLHSRFDWDDAAAAEKWRLEQARELIQSVRVSYTPTTGGERTIRAYVSVNREGRGTPEYVPAEDVAQDPVLRAIALRDMERDWRSFLAKYQQFEEFEELILRDLQPVK